MSDIPGCWRLDHKLHPRTGFMIFFPAICLIAVTLPGFFSDSPNRWGGMEGIAGAALLDLAVVVFLLWLDFGNAVAWDNDTVYVRQAGERLFFRRQPFACVPFADIRGFVLHPPPRGVPPKYPLLEIDAPTHANGPPLFIDPNYFKASSLAMFVEDLRVRVPEIQRGSQAKVAERLLKVFTPKVR